jgi:polyisoprenoid-binding protein YceI
MALAPGSHRLGPDSGTLQVRTYREGVAQKVGHDLIIEVERWEATVDVREDGRPSALTLEADATSLHVREGLRGVKPLSDRDRASIRKEIDGKILLREPIVFRSSAVELGDASLTASGELTMAGTTRPARFELAVAGDGRVSGTLPVTQTDWSIKPYRGLMGALKVRDTVEVVVDARLPST